MRTMLVGHSNSWRHFRRLHQLGVAGDVVVLPTALGIATIEMSFARKVTAP
jgi:hypothetical protein